MINKINKYIFDFLWDGKSDKVNCKTIIQDYEDGELKMINLNIFIISTRAEWVKRITNKESNVDRKHNYIKTI